MNKTNLQKKKTSQNITKKKHMMQYYQQAIYYPEIQDVLQVHYSKMIRKCLKLYT